MKIRDDLAGRYTPYNKCHANTYTFWKYLMLVWHTTMLISSYLVKTTAKKYIVFVGLNRF